MVDLVGSFNPNIIKRKLEFEREKVKQLTTEIVSIRKSFLVQGRRLSSSYCSLSDTMTQTITLESTIEDMRGKLKELRSENKQLRKKIPVQENGKPIVNEKKKQKKTHESDLVVPLLFDGNGVSSSGNGAHSSSSSSVGVAVKMVTLNEKQVESKSVKLTVDPLSDAMQTADETATQKRKRELLLFGDDDLVSVESSTSSQPCGSKSSSTGRNPESFLHRTVRKRFGSHGMFVGMVVAYEHPYFKVAYEDGDSEDLTRAELNAVLTSLSSQEVEKLRNGVVGTEFAAIVNDAIVNGSLKS